jgi:hypothetical protein
VTVVLVSGFSVVWKWVYNQIRTIVRPPLIANFVFQVYHWERIVYSEVAPYIISAKNGIMCEKPIFALGQRYLIVASISPIMGVAF